jgi:hypothetical protein
MVFWGDRKSVVVKMENDVIIWWVTPKNGVSRVVD